MEDIQKLILNQKTDSFRTVVPDIRCICGKIILLSVRNEYLKMEPGNYGAAKNFMNKTGIYKECCMDSLMNVTNFPKFLPVSKGMKEQTLADVKMNERLLAVNELYKKWTLGNDILLLLNDFFDNLELYDTDPDSGKSIAFKDRYLVAKENKDILNIISILKEYIFYLGKYGGLSRMDTLKIELDKDAEKSRKKKVFSIAEKFIKRKNDKVFGAAERLTEIYLEVFPDSYPEKDPSFKLEIGNDFSLEEIKTSKENFMKIILNYGSLPLFYNVEIRIVSNEIINLEGKIENVLENILRDRKYSVSRNRYLIESRGYDAVLEMRNGRLYLEKTIKPVAPDLQVLTGGDEITARIIDTISLVEKVRNYKKIITVETFSRLGEFLLGKINSSLEKFSLFSQIRRILNSVKKLDYYFSGLQNISEKYIKENKLKIVVQGNDNLEFIKLYKILKESGTDKKYIKFMDQKIKELESINIFDIITDIDPMVFNERRIRAFWEYNEKAVKIFDFKYLFDLWNDEPLENFLEKISPSIIQCIQIFDGYRLENKLEKYTGIFFNEFSEYFIEPCFLILQKYEEILEPGEEDSGLEEAYTYLTDPGKKLPKSSGYIVGKEGADDEGEQAELSKLIETGT